MPLRLQVSPQRLFTFYYKECNQNTNNINNLLGQILSIYGEDNGIKAWDISVEELKSDYDNNRVDYYLNFYKYKRMDYTIACKTSTQGNTISTVSKCITC